MLLVFQTHLLYKNINRMKNILIPILLLLLTVMISTEQFRRMGSSPPDLLLLQAGDSVISTLGYFKFILQQNNCQLGIYHLDPATSSYLLTETYTPKQAINCKSIRIDHFKIISDTGIQIAKLSSPSFQATTLTIDDRGNLRFIGIKKADSLTALPDSEEVVMQTVPESKIKHKNVLAGSQFKLDLFNADYVNSKNWIFQVTNNQLNIRKLNNNALSKAFSLESINLDRSGIYDRKNRSSPFVTFQNALKFPQCNLKKSACQYKSPYVIQFNEHWPIVRIYDQQKYLIAEYSLGEASNLVKRKICPAGSFLHKQMCMKKCPQKYYGKIQGESGQCVLTCEQGSIVDEQNKVCSCSYKDLYDNLQDTKAIKKCERQWNTYFYGCDCSAINKVYDRTNSLSCQQKCPQKSFADNGVCFSCDDNCVSCQRDDAFIKYLKCERCIQGYKLSNGECVRQTQTCESNCQICNLRQCSRCINFHSLHQGDCVRECPIGFIETSTPQKGSVCLQSSFSTTPNQNCFTGCIRCNGQNCLQCASGYILFISPLSASCKIKSAALTCSGQFTFQANRQICYIDNLDGVNMAKCKSKIINCQACQFNTENKCILCEQGFYLHNNECVTKCPANFVKMKNVCEEQIQNCQQQDYEVFSQQQIVYFESIKNSSAYKRQTANGREPSNDIGGYIIYTRELILQQDTNNQTSKTVAHYVQKQCVRCRRGFGLSQDKKSCVPCPASCQHQHCYFARQNSCYKPTIKCTFLDENNNCMQSCTSDRYPQIDSKNETRCFPPSLSAVNDYLKVDSSYFIQQDGSKIYYFVLDRPVQKTNTSPTLSFLVGEATTPNGDSHQRRMLVESSNVEAFERNQYYGVKNTKQEAVAIAFDQNVNKFRTAFGFTLANSVYGAQAGYTHNQWMKQWLAHIGYVLSWVILVVHCIYIGNTILYKADNLIIFCQTIYFFSFVKLLVGNTLAQYYYGWFWMHMGFWPNYFKGTIPSQYEEKDAPLSYKLSNLDGNFIRNAGFAISLFITFLALWLAITLIIYLINKVFKKNDIWYKRVAKNTLIAAVQLLSMVIFFFSVTQLLFDGQYPSTSQSFHRANMTVSIIFICLISIYTIVRFIFNKIAGLYMFKRLCIALILVDAYKVDGFLALLIAFEIVFTVIRYFLEKPRLLREKIFMFVEVLLLIVAYFLLFLVLVPGVNVLIITAIIFTLLLFLIADLMDVYLESRNELYDLDLLGQKYDNETDQPQDEVPNSQRKMKH